MTLPKTDFIILGAGISGLAAAHRLASRGYSVTVLEAENHPGGLAATHRFGDLSTDIGPHTFFTDDPEVNNYVLSLSSTPMNALTRRIQLTFGDHFVGYPLKLDRLLSTLGFRKSLSLLSSYLKAILTKKPHTDSEESSVESWAIQSFGLELYRIFFKPYTEQFWQIPANELSVDSIPHHTRFNFVETLLFSLKKKRAEHLLHREALPMLYPRSGFGAIAEHMMQSSCAAGATVHLNSAARRIHQTRQDWHVMTDRGEFCGSRVISTLPLPILFDALSLRHIALDMVHRQLEYRPILLLALRINKRETLQGYQCIYYLGRPYSRLTDNNTFCSADAQSKSSILSAEIPCKFGDSLWHSTPEDLLQKCAPFLHRDTGLSVQNVCEVFSVKRRYAYPVYKLHYRTALHEAKRIVNETQGLYLLGRSGEFRYMDSDRCIRRAWDLVDQLTDRKQVTLTGRTS